MANKNFQKKKIQDMEGSNFGNYDEGTGGGGSPKPRSPAQRAPGVNSEYRQENNDTMQPRTSDGKFTYKSVNGKSIDPKYGPSRGTTVNPLLTGGENGIQISDVENQFANESGEYWDKYKDKWYRKGGEIVLADDIKVHVAAEAIWNVARRSYNEVTGEFGGDIALSHELGDGSTKVSLGRSGDAESETFATTKKGRPSLAAKRAQQQAASSGEDTYVIDPSSGGIRIKPKQGVQLQPPSAQPPQPGATGGNTPIIPSGDDTQPTSSTNVMTTSLSDIENADYTPKYSDNEFAQVKQAMKEAGFTDEEIADFDNLSPKAKDDYIDAHFGEDEEEEATPVDTEPEKEEDSETIKKIKKMGFTDEDEDEKDK